MNDLPTIIKNCLAQNKSYEDFDGGAPGFPLSRIVLLECCPFRVKIGMYPFFVCFWYTDVFVILTLISCNVEQHLENSVSLTSNINELYGRNQN